MCSSDLADGTPRTLDTPIGTGTVIIFADGTEFRAVIYGDVTGSGTVDIANDVSKILAHARGITLIDRDSIFFAAADIFGNGVIDIANVVSRVLAYARGLRESIH